MAAAYLYLSLILSIAPAFFFVPVLQIAMVSEIRTTLVLFLRVGRVEISGLDVIDGLIDSPDAPLEQAYLSYKRVANAGEGWESNWAAKFQHLGAKIQQDAVL